MSKRQPRLSERLCGQFSNFGRLARRCSSPVQDKVESGFTLSVRGNCWRAEQDRPDQKDGMVFCEFRFRHYRHQDSGQCSFHRKLTRSEPACFQSSAQTVVCARCVEVGDGTGDGNRKYRWRALTHWNHQVAIAMSAACDFCAKSRSTRANAGEPRPMRQRRTSSSASAPANVLWAAAERDYRAK
jgi:hypothetical protein